MKGTARRAKRRDGPGPVLLEVRQGVGPHLEPRGPALVCELVLRACPKSGSGSMRTATTPMFAAPCNRPACRVGSRRAGVPSRRAGYMKIIR